MFAPDVIRVSPSIKTVKNTNPGRAPVENETGDRNILREGRRFFGAITFNNSVSPKPPKARFMRHPNDLRRRYDLYDYTASNSAVPVIHPTMVVQQNRRAHASIRCKSQTARRIKTRRDEKKTFLLSSFCLLSCHQDPRMILPPVPPSISPVIPPRGRA